MSSPVLWEELTAPEIRKLSKKIDMVILPVGSTEQHGPHLPTCTDCIFPTELAKAISAETGVPILPTIPYGESQTHKRLGATLWIRPETLHRIVYEICKCVYEQGFHKILIINGHGTNWWPLHTAWSNLRFDLLAAQIKVAGTNALGDSTISMYCSENDRKLLEEIRKLDPNEYHAGTHETSIVLYFRPELVHVNRVVDEPMKTPQGGLFEYRVDQISKSGVCGQPSKATAESGKRLFEANARSFIKWVKAALEEKIPFP